MEEHQKEIYRVILEGIGENSPEEKNEFCRNFSNHYNISFEAIQKIINRFPVVIKKNLTIKKAEALAKNLKAFGARVSIQKKIDLPTIYLEFKSLKQPLLILDSASIRKTQSGLLTLVGRVKNIFKKELNDIWVLVQIFDSNDEVINYEEVPIPINPLPANESSPFKVVFEKDIKFKKVSISFKNSSGFPLASLDGRKKKKWVEIKLEDVHCIHDSKEDKEIRILTTRCLEDRSHKGENNIEEVRAVKESGDINSVDKVLIKEDEKVLIDDQSDFKLDIEEIKDEIFNHSIGDKDRKMDLSIEMQESSVQDLSKKEYILNFPWVEDFKNSIEEYYKKPYDIFINWFNKCWEQKELEGDFHSILTVLINARFNQKEKQEIALENTKKVFKLILQPDISLDKIPPIEGTQFFSPDEWRLLFYRAIPKIKEVSYEIINKKKWDALTLEKLIQIIPHMGQRNSRLAIRWLKNLITDIVVIDCSNANIFIGEEIYRVASRLGILNPNFDHYYGKDSMGYFKIQSFAKELYPKDPIIIEEPMYWIGSENEGFCLPKQPKCLSCLFGEFCYKFYISFDPCEKGFLKV